MTLLTARGASGLYVFLPDNIRPGALSLSPLFEEVILINLEHKTQSKTSCALKACFICATVPEPRINKVSPIPKAGQYMLFDPWKLALKKLMT